MTTTFVGVTDNNHACKRTHINTCAEARRCLEVDRYLITSSNNTDVPQVTSTSTQVGGLEEETIPVDKKQPSGTYVFPKRSFGKVNQFAHSYLVWTIVII